MPFIHILDKNRKIMQATLFAEPEAGSREKPKRTSCSVGMNGSSNDEYSVAGGENRVRQWRILTGDALEQIKLLPDESVNCCVTSPPYWGLRDYGVSGQLGQEKTPEEYVAKMIEVFREVRRVLRSNGTLWLNLGDCYARNPKRGIKFEKKSSATYCVNRQAEELNRGLGIPDGCKEKDLVGIPWMVAFALRADGWYLRCDLIWHKPNPMPESVTDRPTKAHEYLFLLSKSARYYYDQESILEDVSPNTNRRLTQDVEAKIGSERANGGQKTNGNMKAVGRRSWNGSDFDSGKTGLMMDSRGGRKALPETQSKLGEYRDYQRKLAAAGSGIKSNESSSNAVCRLVEKRNKRSVWEVTTQGYTEAHFATFPPKLIEPCILAGCPEGGTVLDPFAGAGTTGLVATRLNRQFLGIELKPAYVEMAERRIREDAPLFNSGNLTPGLGTQSNPPAAKEKK